MLRRSEPQKRLSMSESSEASPSTQEGQVSARSRNVRQRDDGRASSGKMIIDTRTRKSIASGGKVVRRGSSTVQKRKRNYLRTTKDTRSGRFISVANEIIDDNYQLLRRLAK